MERNEEKRIVLTLELADGVQGKRELISLFDAENGRTYAALLPLNDDETVLTNGDIELVRAKQYENDEGAIDFMIESINNDTELSTAKEAFEKLSVIENDEGSEPNIGDLPTMTFKNGTGQLEDWKVVDTFDHNNRSYIALIPMSEAGEGGNINLHLMRMFLMVQGGIEGCEVSAIPSDMEYEEVAAIFAKRIENTEGSV